MRKIAPRRPNKVLFFLHPPEKVLDFSYSSQENGKIGKIAPRRRNQVLFFLHPLEKVFFFLQLTEQVVAFLPPSTNFGKSGKCGT